MQYDLDFRFRRALYPEGLTTVTSCLDALFDARQDACNAGADVARDPAIQLLARRLSRITTGTADAEHPEDQLLRAACTRKIADLKDNPAIIPLVRRSAEHNGDSLSAYRREGHRTLRALGRAMGLEFGKYQLHYNQARPNIPGDHRLTSKNAIIELCGYSFMANSAIGYFHPNKLGDAGRRRTLPIEATADIPRLANRILRDLGITRAPAQAIMP
jgi:hypothetical protein